MKLPFGYVAFLSFVIHGCLANTLESHRSLILSDFFSFLRSLFCGFFLFEAFCKAPANDQSDLVSGDVVDSTVKFSCSETESQISVLGAASASQGDSTIYAGTFQKTSINQNPVVARFTNGVLDWCRDDYEDTGADAGAIGVIWHADRLYAVFATDGIQGLASEDFRRYTSSGWLTSYGSGGGPKVSVVVELDPSTGNGMTGTFLRAQLSNGDTNTLVVKGMFMNEKYLLVQANSWFLPLNADRSRMTEDDCAPDTSSPFDYSVQLTMDLSQAVHAVCRLQNTIEAE